ncbi:MAG: VWA domain-containing protein [Janthinobacterium lividum]
MRRLPLTIVVICAALGALGQGVNPALVIRSKTTLVNVDVIVTDSKGLPVHGLKQEAFTVREDKVEQTVKTFDEHSGAVPLAGAPEPLGVFTNMPPVLKSATENVLVLDWLNTPPEVQPFMRDQLVKFVNTQQSGVPTAIFSLNTKLRLLQDFTSDPRLLKVALLKQGNKFSPLLRNGGSGVDPAVVDFEKQIQRTANPRIRQALEGLESGLVASNAQADSQQLSLRTQQTLSAMTELARFLGGGTSRKNMIWVAGALPFDTLRAILNPNMALPGPDDTRQAFKQALALLAGAGVAIYPVDPSGVVNAPSNGKATENHRTEPLAAERMTGNPAYGSMDDKFQDQRYQQHHAMEEIALATGGKAFLDTNDLVGAFRQATRLGSEFYTLTYAPPPGEDKGRFRSIQVTVAGKDLRLTYRNGYFMPSTAGGKIAAGPALAHAMDPLALPSTQIVFSVRPAISQGTDPAQVIGDAALAKQPHNTVSLNLSIDISSLSFEPQVDGRMHGTVDLGTALYDSNEKLLDTRQDRATIVLTPERYQAMMESGLKLHSAIALQAAGDETIRVGVHDLSTDRIGTLQLSADEVRAAISSTPVP